jgi:hypothetical protein
VFEIIRSKRPGFPDSYSAPSHDSSQERQIVDHFEDLVGLLLVLRHDKGGVGMPDDVFDLRRRAGGIDADAYRGSRHHGQLRVQPFPAILRKDRDLVPPGEPEGGQPQAEPPDVAKVVHPRHPLPDSEILLPEGHAGRILAGPEAQELGKRVRRHDSHRFLRL